MKVSESNKKPEVPKFSEVDDDHEVIMEHVAKEMMDAIEAKDKDKLLESFHCLVADMMDKMSSDTQENNQ